MWVGVETLYSVGSSLTTPLVFGNHFQFYFQTFCLFDTVYFILIVSLCLCVACVIIVCCFHQLLDIIITLVNPNHGKVYIFMGIKCFYLINSMIKAENCWTTVYSTKHIEVKLNVSGKCGKPLSLFTNMDTLVFQSLKQYENVWIVVETLCLWPMIHW